jgi:hypothetical protein
MTSCVGCVLFACRERNLKPNYINIRLNGNNKQCKNTLKTATRTRINQEKHAEKET